jgi:UrcA family protein
MQRSVWFIAAALASSVFAVAAHSAESTDGITRRQLRVEIAGLNLRDDQDARELMQRIEKGARRACGGAPTFSTFTGRLDGTFEECRETAVRKVIEQINSPLVNRIYFDTRNAGR